MMKVLKDVYDKNAKVKYAIDNGAIVLFMISVACMLMMVGIVVL